MNYPCPYILNIIDILCVGVSSMWCVGWTSWSEHSSTWRPLEEVLPLKLLSSDGCPLIVDRFNLDYPSILWRHHTPFLPYCPGSGRLMTRVVCTQLSALRRSSSVGKGDCEPHGGLRVRGQLHWRQLEQRKHEKMPQQIQMFAYCLTTVLLTLVVTFFCLNGKGKMEELWHFIKLLRHVSCVFREAFRAFFHVGRGVDSWRCNWGL